jgi:hypothetical protein
MSSSLLHSTHRLDADEDDRVAHAYAHAHGEEVITNLR